MWVQFRRLVLGTVAEILLEEGLPVRFPSIRIRFDPDSVFKVPRLDNYMRFKGSVSASLETPPRPEVLPRLEARIREAWGQLVTVLEMPIGDRLEVDRVDVRATLAGDTLEIRFDLSAD